MYTARTFVLIGLLLGLTPQCEADSVVVIGANQDNTIFANNASLSSGGSPGTFVGSNGMGQVRRGLIAFDVAGSVPMGAAITSVQLTLYLGNAPSGSPDQAIGLRPLSKNWGEGSAGSTATTINQSGGGFAAANGDATWSDNFLGTSQWAAAGGDFGPISASTIVSAGINSAYSWLSTPALVADVQGWVDLPSSNFGWVLVNSIESASGTARAFYSRNAGDANSPTLNPSFRPSLTISYVPEPNTLLSIAMMSFGVSIRRMRRNVNCR
jgi:hypothetical protein